MVKRYREIRDRYRDVVCGVDDHQMFRDIQQLLHYIECLHQEFARQAAFELARNAFESFEGEPDNHSLTH